MVISTLVQVLELTQTSIMIPGEETKVKEVKDLEKMYIYVKRNGHRIVSESQTFSNKVDQGINNEEMIAVLNKGLE